VRRRGVGAGGSRAWGDCRDRLALSRPYYGAAFELVAGPGGPASLEELAGRPLGVQLQSFAHFAAQTLHLDWRARPTPAETIALLDSGEVAAALLWGPTLATVGRSPDPRWTPPRALRWNEHVAVRRGIALARPDRSRAGAAGARRDRAHGAERRRSAGRAVRDHFGRGRAGRVAARARRARPARSD
jgi:hypothetical protein